MDPLDFLTNEELIRFFHCKKTEMSCIEQPNTFLNQLRDHNLVTEKLYKKVRSMKCKERKKEGVYEVLDRLEKERSDSVKVFWRCVFRDHILQKYPVLRVLRNSLMDGSFKYYDKLPNAEEEKDSLSKEHVVKGKRKGCKRKKSDEKSEEDEQPGPSYPSSPSQKKPLKKPIFSSPVKKGEKLDIWTWDFYQTQLPVTCGDKKATLDRNRLAKGGKCILSQGHWFTPSGFEEFAGKGRWKNWKLSIRCQNTPLLKLIKEGHLNVTSPMKRKCVEKSQRQLFSPSSPESCSSTSSEEMEESVGQGVKRNGEEEEEEEDEEEEDEDEGEEVNLSEFEGPTLPVSCGSVSGVLFKSRFASGTRSRSIRTAECWLTPQEFVKQDGYWRRDIKCQGKTLNSLLQKVLKVHSMLCKCSLCHPTEEQQLDQNNDDQCFICNSHGDLVCCDDCPRAFHNDCHIPALQNDTLGERWMCTYCVWKNNQRLWRHVAMTEEQALKSRVTQYFLHCEYLLLLMCKEDTQCVFRKDPSTMVCRYRSFISEPMWLDRVNEKLHTQEYHTLRQFVCDMRLIFQNCSTFNKKGVRGDRSRRRMMRHCRTQETSSLPRRGRATSSLPSSAQITSTNRPADSSSPFVRSKAEIPVTCGPKKGTLYTDKFSNSEACIFSQGKWFTPSQFEVFGGTRGSKKSRTSIFYHGVPLQILIQDGFLPPTSFKMKTEDVQHAVPGSSPDISNITQRQKRQTEKIVGPKKDIAEKQKRKTGKTTRSSGDTRHSKASTEKMEESVGQGVKQNEEEDDEEKEDEEDEEEEEELDLNNDDQCFICNCERNLVYCGSCSRAFHNDCHIPALTTNTHDNKSRERWMCTYCVWRNNQRLWRRVAMTEEQALNSPVSPYILVTPPTNTHRHTHHTDTHIQTHQPQTHTYRHTHHTDTHTGTPTTDTHIQTHPPHRHTYRHIQTHKPQTHTYRHTNHTDTHIQTHTDTHIQTHTYRHTHHTDTHIQTHQPQTHTYRYTYRHTNHRHTHTQTHQPQTHTYRHTNHRHTHTDTPTTQTHIQTHTDTQTTDTHIQTHQPHRHTHTDTYRHTHTDTPTTQTHTYRHTNHRHTHTDTHTDTPTTDTHIQTHQPHRHTYVVLCKALALKCFRSL
ncbi:uncharacterized protein LOC143517559 isoform X2 [Brachyhypopomus gauderio]|uniref:uncharacterized protein LOC143517559 isoform X2 n=1 Tax=Brachyhypopomus gauderio TaxID=698409 RepID=UPI0040434C1C